MRPAYNRAPLDFNSERFFAFRLRWQRALRAKSPRAAIMFAASAVAKLFHGEPPSSFGDAYLRLADELLRAKAPPELSASVLHRQPQSRWLA